MVRTERHSVDNGDGWSLALTQTFDDERLDRAKRPVLIVPGYGMNSFIFSYHPHGQSLEGFLVDAGLEVWRVDLRAQGESTSTGGSTERFGLAELALVDLPAAISEVLARTQTEHETVDVIGASLGGSIVVTYAVMTHAPRVGSLVLMGAPLRWVDIHPLIRLAFSSPMAIGLVRFRNTRKLAETVLPLLAKIAPSVLSFYLNPNITDVGAARELVRTVEDPRRRINRQIAHWMRARDLIIRGTTVSARLDRLTQPLLCVLANGDGVVPRKTARFAYDEAASTDKTLLEIGSDEQAHAHADLFVSTGAQDRVFSPIASWLKSR